MTGQGSHASLVVAIVTAGVTLGSITEALANGKAYDRSSHLGRGSKVESDFGHGRAGTRLSLSTKDPFGVARAKDTFAVLTRVMVGILAPTMACWQRGLEGGVAFGIVARDVNFASSSIPETELLKPIT
jgi:hypothetical protein